VLDALIRGGVEITGVLGLDEARGREICDYRSLRAPVEAAGIPFCSFDKVTEPSVETFLRAHAPDLLWVIGLSQLVPDGLIALARHGGVGFHPTMLPKGRGRAPVAWTILLDQPAAATLFFLTGEPDAGDIIVQRPVEVRPDDYSEDLIGRTNQVLAEAIVELAPQIRSGRLPRTPQDHSQATHYETRTAADGRIDWNRPAHATYRLIRAAGRPYHGAFGHLGDRKLVIWRARPGSADENQAAAGRAMPKAGAVLGVDPAEGVTVRTGEGSLVLTEIEFDPPGTSDPIEEIRSGDQLA